MAAAFKRACGDVTFELLEVEKTNGRQLFHRVLPVWLGKVGEFLQRAGIAAKPTPD